MCHQGTKHGHLTGELVLGKCTGKHGAEEHSDDSGHATPRRRGAVWLGSHRQLVVKPHEKQVYVRSLKAGKGIRKPQRSTEHDMHAMQI